MQGRIFSGIQPTSGIHLGNYLGAIRHWVRLQSAYECIYCLVDQHAITVLQEPEQMRATPARSAAASRRVASIRKRSILFVQSRCRRMPSWPGCSAAWPAGLAQPDDPVQGEGRKDRENAPVGLYTYPVLMAADILVYRATHVPVGEDQKQHLELARDIARHRFNRPTSASSCSRCPSR